MTVTLHIPTTLEATVEANARAKSVCIVPPPPPGSENWTLQDALDFAGPLPDNLGRATALASEATLAKFWNSPEDAAAFQGHEG